MPSLEEFLLKSDKYFYIRTDLVGNYTFVNPSFQIHYSHVAPDGFLGKPFHGTVHPDDVQKCILAALNCLRKAGSVFSVKLRKPMPSGEHSWTYWEFMAQTDEYGSPVEIICIGCDITSIETLLNKLDMTQKVNQALVENIAEGIVTTDLQGYIETANRKLCKIFGYEESEIVGQKIELLIANPVEASMHDSYIANYLKTGEKHIMGIGRDVMAKRKNGQIFKARLEISEIVVDNQRKFIGLIRDISAEHEAYLQIQKYARTLEEIANFQSHFVRRPVANILGLLQLIEMEPDREINREYLAYLRRCIEDLDEVIHEIVRRTYNSVQENQNNC